MHSHQLKLVALCVLAVPTTAAAEPMTDLHAVRSQIGWGASVNPDRVGLTSEGGWNGGDRRVVVGAAAEATVFARASVLASTTYGGLYDHARPAVGVAYQLIDPRTGANGARISLSYKPEGFTEPEGELESVLVLTRRLDGDALRGMLAYGQDPEGRESDAELGASYLHQVSSSIVVGGTARYRRALALKVGEPRWDFIGGGIGSLVVGRSRIELLLGGDTIAYAAVQSGVVGLVSVGADL